MLPKHPQFLLFSIFTCALYEPVAAGRREDPDPAGYEHIADGYFGSVYKEKRAAGTPHALKRSTRSDRRNTQGMNEINALKQLKHENIISMLSYWEKEVWGTKRTHVKMEYMPCTLEAAVSDKESYQKIRKNKRKILLQILKGIFYIHSQEMAHGDIKPDNILIDVDTMAVKICDFGLCVDRKSDVYFPGEFEDGHRQDVLGFCRLMAFVFLGKDVLIGLSVDRGTQGDISAVFRTEKTDMLSPGEEKLLRAYRKLGSVLSKDGMDLFLKILSRKSTDVPGAEELKHPFFEEECELDPSMEQRGDDGGVWVV
ncbi:MAG: CMGC/CDK protein kinase [Amphiamblys sp. WSBS2006]|nr:MAG: CMGC/CDK protein kinase [Amphiamblys sp. WSBS2006]